MPSEDDVAGALHSLCFGDSEQTLVLLRTGAFSPGWPERYLALLERARTVYQGSEELPRAVAAAVYVTSVYCTKRYADWRQLGGPANAETERLLKEIRWAGDRLVMPEEVRANAGSKETHETRSVVGRFLRRRLPFLVVVLLLAVLGVFLFVIELPPDVGRAIHAYFNYGEALFWGIAGVCVFRRSRKQPPASRSAGSVAAVAFIAFGVSDLIEVRTGTWYDPWWLFAWKATCVVTLVSCLLVHVRRSGKAPFSG